MLIPKKFKRRKSFSEVFESIVQDQNSEHELGELQVLVDLVQVFRPINLKQVETISIASLIDYLEENEDARLALKFHLKKVLANKKIKSLLTESGILQNINFKREIRKRLFAKILPYQPKQNTLEFVMNQVFFMYSDIIWLEKIPREEIDKLVDVLEFDTIYFGYKTNTILKETLEAMSLISQRISGRALEAEVLQMVPEFEAFDSPFDGLENELDQIESNFRKNNLAHMSAQDVDYKQVMMFHRQCVAYIETAYKNSSVYGISITVNQSLLRIKQQLKRFKTLLDFLCVENEEEKKQKSIDFALKLIQFNCKKNNVRKLFNESTQILAYEITQHTAKTGEHYITEGRREYFNMLRTAMGGGLIVGLMCVFKIMLGYADVSDFGHAFLYSMNYSFGFIAIYLLGFTLATKQPAMTAATLVQSIEKGMKNKAPLHLKHEAFAALFSRLFRSQFIAFVGNVIVAFPVAMLFVYGIDKISGVNLTETKADKLITNLSPVHSMAILHAAIAGCFLFLSGIISGSISNKNKHINLYYRIQENTFLKLSFGKLKTTEIAQWFEKKWPAVASNFWFGVFMGTTASVGVFFGLNLDIRHITFASGNLALGLYGADFHVSGVMLFLGIFGIGIIGFVNFIVSFMLSMTVAFRSREIPWTEMKNLFLSVWYYFKQNPKVFFIPIQKKKFN